MNVGEEAIIQSKNVREQEFLWTYAHYLSSIGNPRAACLYVIQE
jgi:hypothetical protein